MRWPWGSWKPASKSGQTQDEGQDAATEHHRHFHVEHGDVETESASSEHWPVLAVEEAIHVEDPAADQPQSCSAAEESTESSCSSESEGGYDEAEAGGGRRGFRRGPRGRARRRRPRGGMPVRTIVGAAAAVLLALVAVVASWRRRRRPAAGS